MKIAPLTLVALLASMLTAPALAQGPGNAEIYSPGYVPPDQATRAGAAEQAAAKASRRAEGARAAREGLPGEGTSIPAVQTKFSSEERRSAGAARRAEVGRAIRAGELNTFDLIGGP